MTILLRKIKGGQTKGRSAKKPVDTGTCSRGCSDLGQELYPK